APVVEEAVDRLAQRSVAADDGDPRRAPAERLAHDPRRVPRPLRRRHVEARPRVLERAPQRRQAPARLAGPRARVHHEEKRFPVHGARGYYGGRVAVPTDPCPCHCPSSEPTSASESEIGSPSLREGAGGRAGEATSPSPN